MASLQPFLGAPHVGEREPQLEVGLGVLGVGGDGLPVLGLGHLEGVGGQEGGEGEAGARAVRLDLHRTQVGAQRLAPPLLAGVEHGQVLVGVGGGRVEGDGLLELLLGLLEPAAVGELDAPLVVLVGLGGPVPILRHGLESTPMPGRGRPRPPP
jgi:hypothetical protein